MDDSKIEILLKMRIYLLAQIDSLSLQLLNKIPPGFNNNVIWNLGHMITVQQTMCYTRSGISPLISDEFSKLFLPGTKPVTDLNDNMVADIKQMFVEVINRFMDDVKQDIFRTYSPSVMIPKTYGFEVINIHEAIDYLLYHDALHAGQIFAIKKLLISNPES